MTAPSNSGSRPLPPIPHSNPADIFIRNQEMSFLFQTSSVIGYTFRDIIGMLNLCICVSGTAPGILQLRTVTQPGGVPSSQTMVYDETSSLVIPPGVYICLSSNGIVLRQGICPIREEKKMLPERPLKRARGSAEGGSAEGGSTEDGSGSKFTASHRDDSNDNLGFKSRLIRRDMGCGPCIAMGIPAIGGWYMHNRDSQKFHGAHIIPFSCQAMWIARDYKAKVTDPYTANTDSNPETMSWSARLGYDFWRINSLDNGLLLCPNHHISFDLHEFAIHPETHKIFAFHQAASYLHNKVVEGPWKEVHPDLVPPHPDFLHTHFMSCIAYWMQGGAEPIDLEIDDDEDDEEEELSEIEDLDDYFIQVQDWRDAIANSLGSLKANKDVVSLPEYEYDNHGLIH